LELLELVLPAQSRADAKLDAGRICAHQYRKWSGVSLPSTPPILGMLFLDSFLGKKFHRKGPQIEYY
jgi:hypothetical protein